MSRRSVEIRNLIVTITRMYAPSPERDAVIKFFEGDRNALNGTNAGHWLVLADPIISQAFYERLAQYNEDIARSCKNSIANRDSLIDNFSAFNYLIDALVARNYITKEHSFKDEYGNKVVMAGLYLILASSYVIKRVHNKKRVTLTAVYDYFNKLFGIKEIQIFWNKSEREILIINARKEIPEIRFIENNQDYFSTKNENT